MEGSWILIYIYIYISRIPRPWGWQHVEPARTTLLSSTRYVHHISPLRFDRFGGGRGLRIAKVKLTRRQLVRASEIRSSGIFFSPLSFPRGCHIPVRRRGAQWWIADVVPSHFFLFLFFFFRRRWQGIRSIPGRRVVVADRIYALQGWSIRHRYERHLRNGALTLARDFSSDEGREEISSRDKLFSSLDL